MNHTKAQYNSDKKDHICKIATKFSKEICHFAFRPSAP